MKTLNKYIAICLLGGWFTSCGTDLEPEIFPNRVIDKVEDFVLSDVPLSPDQCTRIFVSETEVYYYLFSYDVLAEFVAFDLQTGEKRTVSLTVEGDDEQGTLRNELTYLLSDIVTRIKSSSPAGSCWYEGKGYVVGTQGTYIYSPETETWSYRANTGFDESKYDFNQASNVVVDGDVMVRITPNRMYRFSLTAFRWESIPMTHNFMLSGSMSRLLCGGGNLYVFERDGELLYVYDKNSNLWKEYLSLTDLKMWYYTSFDYVLINGDTFYFFPNYYNRFAMEWNHGKKTATLLKLEAVWEFFNYYSGLEQSGLFNVADTCYGLGYDGTVTDLIKFNLK